MTHTERYVESLEKDNEKRRKEIAYLEAYISNLEKIIADKDRVIDHMAVTAKMKVA